MSFTRLNDINNIWRSNVEKEGYVVEKEGYVGEKATNRDSDMTSVEYKSDISEHIQFIKRLLRFLPAFRYNKCCILRMLFF